MSEEDRMSRRDEIEALLPFYLNGTLSGADLSAVEEWLRNDRVGAFVDRGSRARAFRDDRRQ